MHPKPLETALMGRNVRDFGAWSRRAFLRRSSAALAGVALASRAGISRSAADGRWFKIGACEWSLRRSDPSCFAVAKDIGLDGVQVNLGSVANGLHLRREDVQKAYLEASRKHGVAIASLAIAEFNGVPLATEPVAALWLLDSLEVARALGVKVVLMAFFGRGELRADDARSVDRLVGLLKEVAPRAEKAGLILGLEDYLSAEENVRIIDRVGSGALQVYYDVGNSTDKGYDILKEIRFLGKDRICELHAKDGPHLFGKGRIDFREVRKAIDEIGYSGWIQIEGAAPNDLIQDYRANLAYLRDVFPAKG